jgi:hypothetical protein
MSLEQGCRERLAQTEDGRRALEVLDQWDGQLALLPRLGELLDVLRTPGACFYIVSSGHSITAALGAATHTSRCPAVAIIAVLDQLQRGDGLGPFTPASAEEVDRDLRQRR